MLDRLFMPALTFTLLVAATAAFAADFAAGSGNEPTQRIVRLETVVVSAKAEAVSHAAQAVETTALR